MVNLQTKVCKICNEERPITKFHKGELLTCNSCLYKAKRKDRGFDVSDLDGEEWMDIEGYEGIFQVSNLGRIKSLERIIERGGGQQPIFVCAKILNSKSHPSGYSYVKLSVKGCCKHLRVHRIVAMHFISNPNNLPHVNHINGIKTDNRVCNLEWCTAQENSVHAWKTGLQKKRLGSEIPHSKKVIHKPTKRIFDSITAVAKFHGFSDVQVRNYLNEKIKRTHVSRKGFHVLFEYEYYNRQ